MTEPAEESDVKQETEADGGKTAKCIDDITKEEAVALPTVKFPQIDMQKMLDMPSKAAMVKMAEAFNSLAPQKASTDVKAHIQALMLCLMRDVASEDPEFTIKLEQAGESPPACPECGADYVRNGVRHNKKGPERTYRCKGPKRHRFVFNPGFEGRRYSNKLITRAVRLYCRTGSVRSPAWTARTGGPLSLTSTTLCRLRILAGRRA